jgi:hypothetical protein
MQDTEIKDETFENLHFVVTPAKAGSESGVRRNDDLRPLHNYIKPAIMSYQRVAPVKTGAVSSIIKNFIDSGLRRNDE